MRTFTKISAVIAWATVVVTAMAQPQYQIFDIGVIQMTDNSSQGFNASPGGVAVGRSIQGTSTSQAFTWTQGGGLVGLPSLAGRNHSVSNSANDNGIVVGTASTTLFGSSRLPVIWNNGAVSQLPLPAGETLGDANSVNASGVAVGSVDGGSLQQAVIYNGANATVITQTTPTGCFFVTAFGINDSGRIVGQGIDPNNAARNVGIVYDMGQANAFEVGAIPGANGALAFAVGNGGHVVGSSMMNQGSGTPFIWSNADGMVAIPLATGTSEGSARGVNSAGWVVGQDSSAFSIPFLWDRTTTYRLADLLPAGSGWDLDMNTSSSALGISDNGVIVGTGVHNGNLRAYAMVPVTATPTATPTPPVTTPTPTPASTPTPTPAATPTPTATPQGTPTPSATPQGTATPEPSPTPTPPTQPLNVSTRVRVQTGDNAGIGGFIITGTEPKHVLLRGIGPSLAPGVGDVLANPTLDLRDSNGVRILANDNWRDTQEAEINATGIPPTNDLEAAIVETLEPGTYTVILRGMGMTSGIGLVEIYDLDRGADSKLANLSTRALVGTGDSVVIAGFILGGSGNDRVIMRGIGPSLTALGVANALPDPTLELRNSNGALLITNNDWQDDPEQAAQLAAVGLAPTSDFESGMAATLPPGLYTALLAGRNGGSGVGLVEVYDLGP